MLLQHQTWQEVEAYLGRSKAIVLPIGSTEQHGPNGLIGTDAICAEVIARGVGEAADALVGPTIGVGIAVHHMGFAGTVSASVDTYLALAAEIIGSIAQAGFSKILVLNSHGGNASALDVVLTKLRLLHPATRIVLVTYWNIAAQQLGAIRQSKEGGMGHACELETSLVLAEKPQLVRADRLKADGKWPASRFLASDMLAGGPATVSRAFSEISAEGAVGDPQTASSEKGQRFFDAIVAQLRDLVNELASGKLEEFRAAGT